MLNKKFSSLLAKSLFFIILITLINGRSFLGLYIFGFRIGEYLTGLSILISLLVFIRNKYFVENLNIRIVYSYFFLIGYFFVLNIFRGGNFLDLYVYKSSIFIWFISFFFLGYIVFDSINLTDNFLIFGYVGLLLQYLFNVIYYPDFLTNFFNNFSDKTQFLKGSEIAIFYIVVTFFANSVKKKGKYLDAFILISSIYISLALFKSRSAGIALIIYFLVEIYVYRKYLKSNVIKSIILFLIFSILFSLSSFYLIDNPPTIYEADDAIGQVLKHKYVVSNTYDDDVPLIYFYEGRLYSADGNLNWRFQLWQEVISDSQLNNYILFGRGFDSKIPIFENQTYSGLDGTNENTHNYFLNIYARAGLVGLIVVFYFFGNLINVVLSKFPKKRFLSFLFPLFFISMFDGSMENPYFAPVFYFFMSSFFTSIKFKEESTSN